MREVYHLKLHLILWRPKGVHAVMREDKSAWYAYHKLHGHHTENCHQLKNEIEILIHRGRLLLYVKDIERQIGNKSLTREDTDQKTLR